MVGRDEELGRALAILRRTGPAPFVVVEGEAGIGKTRFLIELADGARRDGWAVVVGAAERPEGPDPAAFGLWNAVLRDLGLRLPPVDPTMPADERRCMVFDEVDSGIGGAIAEVVGRQLRRFVRLCGCWPGSDCDRHRYGRLHS